MTGLEIAALAAIGGKMLTDIIGGHIAGGASKVEAQFAALAAYQRGSDIASNLNVALASQAVAGRASGFASTGGSLMDADRTRAAQDIEAARYQGFLESNALKHQGRAQIFKGYADALGTAATAAAGASGGGGGSSPHTSGPYGGGNSADGNWGR